MEIYLSFSLCSFFFEREQFVRLVTKTNTVSLVRQRRFGVIFFGFFFRSSYLHRNGFRPNRITGPRCPNNGRPSPDSRSSNTSEYITQIHRLYLGHP